ncbi:MAG: AsmA family protein [Bdellovibrionota bacterium]
MQRKKWLKWIGIGLGSFFGLLLLIALLVPLFFDVDKYRPEIVTAAEQNLNGKLELGKLSLSLWGRLRVNVDGFSLSDSNGHKVVAAKDVFFEVPFGSLLIGAPSLTFNLKEPELYVHREANGDLNVSQLVKSSGEEKKEDEPSETEKESTELPGIVASARLGLALTNANLVYEDKKSNIRTQVKDFNVVAKNLSLSSPSELEVWAQIDTL